MSNALETLKAILAEKLPEDQVREIIEELTIAAGNGSVAIAGDASGAVTVTGSQNIAGDHNHVVIHQGISAEELVKILQKLQQEGQQFTSVQTVTSSVSVDELVEQVRSRIHDDIQRLHGTMPLWGVDHWVPLGELFVDVNILEEVSSNRRSELDDLWQDFNQNPGYRGLDRMGLGKERQRVSGLAVLDRNTNLMVVGKPGSGKTTYLQRVVTECNAGNLQAHRIPVLIRLREFVEDGRGVDYAVERYLEWCWLAVIGDRGAVGAGGGAIAIAAGWVG